MLNIIFVVPGFHYNMYRLLVYLTLIWYDGLPTLFEHYDAKNCTDN